MRSSLKVLSREDLRSFVDQQSLALDREIGKGRQLRLVTVSKSVHAVQSFSAVPKDQIFALERVVALQVPAIPGGDVFRIETTKLGRAQNSHSTILETKPAESPACKRGFP